MQIKKIRDSRSLKHPDTFSFEMKDGSIYTGRSLSDGDNLGWVSVRRVKHTSEDPEMHQITLTRDDLLCIAEALGETSGSVCGTGEESPATRFFIQARESLNIPSYETVCGRASLVLRDCQWFKRVSK